MTTHAIEIIRVSPQWKTPLKQFLLALESNGDSVYFSPHAYDDTTLNQIADDSNQDLHYVLVEDQIVLGYGLLRGWNEGFNIPSLGIAIHPNARGKGLATMLMQFLHISARINNATKVRLRVLKKNEKAHLLYSALGYQFEDDDRNEQFLVGFKQIDD